MPTKVPLTTI